jgi:polysaccharide biosynthesis protein PelF
LPIGASFVKSVLDSRRPRVLVTTEGTYPFVLGGVSTWCDALMSGLVGVDFSVLAITAGGLRRPSLFPSRPNVTAVDHLDLWSETITRSHMLVRDTEMGSDLPALLARGILGWNSDVPELRETLVWCRRNAKSIRPIFRRKASWHGFLSALRNILNEHNDEVLFNPRFDMLAATDLYRLLFWIAQTAAHPTPEGIDTAPDLLLVTAAGWASIPAVIHKSLHGTPMTITEHGVYVREAYLANTGVNVSSTARWTSSRVARGLSRLAYASADVVSPVTQANASWEREFKVDPRRIQTIYNGVVVPATLKPAPQTRTVVAVGRVDPLKDIKTMLRCAAEVLLQEPKAKFLHYGPVPAGNEDYYAECLRLHADLGLGDRFVFKGSTADPYGVVMAGDVALLTSISEGSPITVLEAMACGRPIVATAVGGVPEAMHGCGFTARPHDHRALAAGVLRLLEEDDLAASLGERAYQRAATVFGQSTSLENYRRLIADLTKLPIVPARLPHAKVSAAFTAAGPDIGDHDAIVKPERDDRNVLPESETVSKGQSLKGQSFKGEAQ